MNKVLLTRRGVVLLPGIAANSLSVSIDGRRIWTFSPTAARRLGVVVPWPAELLRAMEGRSQFEVWDDHGTRLGSRTLSFGTSTGPIMLKDADGRMLTVNKWGRLTQDFEDQSEETRERLIARTAEVLEQLRDLGFDAFIVGGTLLGAIRNGDLLAHDDDADTAYVSKFSHPSDVALESFRLQRDFEDRGYWIVRHSVSHFQVMFKTDSGLIDHFVDVFTAVFKEGRFYEPIHVDTDAVVPADILPTRPLPLGNMELQAPADPEKWLAACYGPNWRTPDPTFTFETPRDTVRRFHSWFGGMSTHRLYWDAHYQRTADASSPSEGAKRFAQLLTPGSHVVEFGCGTGADARYLASLGHTVLAVDFSWVAIERAREAVEADDLNVEFRVANLYDRRQMLSLAIELRSLTPSHVFMNHSIEGMTNSARLNAALFCREVLRDDAFAYLVSYGTPGRDFDYSRPETWHVAPRDILKTAHDFGLSARIVRSEVATERGDRRLLTDAVIKRNQKGHE
ncbi:Methyltransferase domain-containing protein [Paramicrobacterium humi]|uniref:Methyltransferase domain-containing protein n=1 Tax=Paramicrobacterium humi TaxID=640635 RepID=A0A1H4IRM9_9MICO|nr:class I SAM-dependent methyltransferase [Microbacterium humi]SEB36720.1 Methyltransferase domain-containing protein [Microbacterium humi]